jgi:ribosomal protein S3
MQSSQWRSSIYAKQASTDVCLKLFRKSISEMNSMGTSGMEVETTERYKSTRLKIRTERTGETNAPLTAKCHYLPTERW